MTAPHRAARTAFLLSSILLGACGYITPTAVSGNVIFPPTAGEARLMAVVNQRSQAVAVAQVQGSGAYRVNLPAQPPLPVQANIAFLHSQITSLPSGFSPMNCLGSPQVSHPGARVVTLTEGEYVVGGHVIGLLRPMTGILGGRLWPQESVTTLSTFVYADRSVTVTGTLPCTFTLTGGDLLAAQLQVDYQLSRGWNTVSIRLQQPGSGGVMQVSTYTQNLQAVDWRYYANH